VAIKPIDNSFIKKIARI